ncbi:MAG: protein kinase, partial [Planctomycetaceae bacterium]|nr:protein kinase [Planctomycetaceae bacterium]
MTTPSRSQLGGHNSTAGWLKRAFNLTLPRMPDSLDQYRLVEQIAATLDAVRYRAVRVDSAQPVEVQLLKTSDPDRSQRSHRRVKLTQMVHDPGIRPVLAYEPKAASPFVVLPELIGRTLREVLGTDLPIGSKRALEIVSPIASALVAAHRVGLAHGGLTPEHVTIAETVPETTTACQICFATSPAGSRDDFAEDVRQLGDLWFWLTANDLPAEQAALRDGMRSADPLDRPKADDVSGRLRDWLFSETSVGSSTRIVPASEPDENPAGGGTNIMSPAEIAESIEHERQEISERTRNHAADRSRHESRSKGSSPGLDPLLDRPQLGRFNLLKKLGEGGMGAVWKAEDPLDGRIVAIKVLRSELAKNETALRRFHREARMLAEVESPYIANLLELNEDDGLQFIVMEFVEGQDVLASLKARGRLPERDAVAMVADVARALREAHTRGVVHRDLKPENMLLVANAADKNAPPRVKLTDFGLAREILESESQQLTSAGSVLGTPNYMSPEQCSGTVTVDARADVYSLGATLFHLLAGRPPFQANSVMGIIAKQVNDPAPLIRTIVPDLSEAVEQR